MPPMPPIPPIPPGIPPPAPIPPSSLSPFLDGFSTTTASVVSISAATDAAFSSAVRVTLVGSITPASIRSSYFSLLALYPNAPSPSSTFCTTRSEEHTSELQSRGHLVCRLLLEKKKKNNDYSDTR